jgi:hypothetical protein
MKKSAVKPNPQRAYRQKQSTSINMMPVDNNCVYIFGQTKAIDHDYGGPRRASRGRLTPPFLAWSSASTAAFINYLHRLGKAGRNRIQGSTKDQC